MDEQNSSVLKSVSVALTNRREVEAVDTLVDYFDRLFTAGEFEAARRTMAQLDPMMLPPKVLTGVLMVSAHAREQLGVARTNFFEQAKTALATKWKLLPEAIESVERRLR